MFSIIISVYNVEEYLEKCLQSVIGQTYKDIEIIIVNDGSTDSSAEIVEKHRICDNRIKVVTHENRGVSSARNSGLAVATMEYIMFIDSDDFIEVNTCERLAVYINKNKSDIYIFGLYYNYGTRIDIGSQKLYHEEYKSGLEYVETALEKGNFRTFAWNKIYKRRLLGIESLDSVVYDKEVRFIEGLIYEDMFFSIQVLYRANTVTVIPEYFYYYVQHNNKNITAQYRMKDLDILKFIDILSTDYYKTNKINKYVYAVLVFRWVSSCLVYKYVKKYYYNNFAKQIIDSAFANKSFIEAVKLCATIKKTQKRDRYLARLLYVCPFLYITLAIFLVLGKNLRKKILFRN